MLVKFVEGKRKEWDTVLDSCIFAYNTSKHASSLYSPFEIMYGRKAVLPVQFSTEDQEGTIVPEEIPASHVSLIMHVFQVRMYN